MLVASRPRCRLVARNLGQRFGLVAGNLGVKLRLRLGLVASWLEAIRPRSRLEARNLRRRGAEEPGVAG